ncbi:TLDc [Nesidiocoris tenuis]|uniref:MTOR-associated protein MEAK7 n=1 Tax=Nesidiocoris tenuis TaxID=355587 RepID=A0ABN7B7M4_9HEMI|nr:TLDc [Nesidiocoris tenuis]
MGQKKSKSGQNETDRALVTFTAAEWKRVNGYFQILEGAAVVDKKLFEKAWNDYLPVALKECWIQYLYPDGLGAESFDRNRFVYLYKSQKSKLYEIKTLGILRILSNMKTNAEVTYIGYEKVTDYLLHTTAAYLRGLWRHRNPEIMIWLNRQATVSVKTLKQFILIITSSLKAKTDIKGMITCKDLEDFLRSNRILSEVIEELVDLSFGMVDPSTQHSLLPRISPRYSTILDLGEILFLSSHLMKSWTQYWKLRFQNKGHGSNFTMLCETIVDVGPTIIIVRDTHGNVFGCCASESWKPRPTFYGDCRCFLFQLKPFLKYYGASPYNQNYQYHNQNQHVLPNGFGMGGVIGIFGLWLDGDFGKGFSAEFCSTFNDYERLSGSVEFHYDHIEVWTINETFDPDGSDEDLMMKKRSKSVMDATQLTNALLTMLGRQPQSS